MHIILYLLLIELALSCNMTDTEGLLSAICIMRDKNGTALGKVTFQQEDCETPLKMNGAFFGLPPYVPYAFHIHENGLVETCNRASVGRIHEPFIDYLKLEFPREYKADKDGNGMFSFVTDALSLRGISSLVGRSCMLEIPSGEFRGDKVLIDLNTMSVNNTNTTGEVDNTTNVDEGGSNNRTDATGIPDFIDYPDTGHEPVEVVLNFTIPNIIDEPDEEPIEDDLVNNTTGIGGLNETDSEPVVGSNITNNITGINDNITSTNTTANETNIEGVEPLSDQFKDEKLLVHACGTVILIASENINFEVRGRALRQSGVVYGPNRPIPGRPFCDPRICDPFYTHARR
jgi:Cu/Zn superoxide dismutase